MRHPFFWNVTPWHWIVGFQSVKKTHWSQNIGNQLPSAWHRIMENWKTWLWCQWWLKTYNFWVTWFTLMYFTHTTTELVAKADCHLFILFATVLVKWNEVTSDWYQKYDKTKNFLKSVNLTVAHTQWIEKCAYSYPHIHDTGCYFTNALYISLSGMVLFFVNWTWPMQYFTNRESMCVCVCVCVCVRERERQIVCVCACMHAHKHTYAKY